MENLESLWSVQFVTTDQSVGGGVVVFETGRIFGGDSSFFYLGNYTVNGGQLEATVHVKRHSPGLPSAFGPLEDFELKMIGKMVGDQLQVSGEVVGYPGQQIRVIFTHQASLP